jgi:hypothetical protein
MSSDGHGHCLDLHLLTGHEQKCPSFSRKSQKVISNSIVYFGEMTSRGLLDLPVIMLMHVSTTEIGCQFDISRAFLA